MEYNPCTECRHGPDCAGCAYHEERGKRVRTDLEVARLREESAEAFAEYISECDPSGDIMGVLADFRAALDGKVKP